VTDREFLRHTLATLAYRCGKTVRGAPPEFAGSRAGPSTRTPLEILAHIGDLLDWALSIAKGEERWNNATPQPWDDEVARFFAALKALDDCLASPEPLQREATALFQGPIADALTHTGQLAMLRRLRGAPMKGENYSRAEIAVGRVGTEQAAPKREFD
jgi:hypothetical protein